MKKLWLGLALVIGIGLLWRACRSDRGAAPGEAGGDLLYDRLWVDHLPANETDRFEIFAVVTERPMGVFQASSLWKGSWELFRYEPRGSGRIVLLYPQTGEKERVAYRARRCDEKRFDFCMELSGASRGAKRYFSQKGWEIGGVSTPGALAERMTKLVRALPSP